MALAVALLLCGAVAAQDPTYSFSVTPHTDDVRTVERWVTAERVEQARALGRLDTSSDELRQARELSSQSLRRLPTLVGYLEQHSPEPLPLAIHRESFARIKSIARRYFDAESFRATVDLLTPEVSFYEQSHRLADRLAALPTLPVVDSLTTRDFRLLDSTAPEVRARLYRVGAAHYNRGRYPEGLSFSGEVAVDESPENPQGEDRGWIVGAPIVLFPTGPRGTNPNPLHTMIAVPFHHGGRVYGVATFSAYSADLSTSTVFGRDLDMSRYPMMSLEAAGDIVRRETGEEPVRALYLNPYVQFLLPVPAVLTDAGSIYLVDPVVELVW